MRLEQVIERFVLNGHEWDVVRASVDEAPMVDPHLLDQLALILTKLRSQDQHEFARLLYHLIRLLRPVDDQWRANVADYRRARRFLRREKSDLQHLEQLLWLVAGMTPLKRREVLRVARSKTERAACIHVRDRILVVATRGEFRAKSFDYAFGPADRCAVFYRAHWAAGNEELRKLSHRERFRFYEVGGEQSHYVFVSFDWTIDGKEVAMTADRIARLEHEIMCLRGLRLIHSPDAQLRPADQTPPTSSSAARGR